MDNWILIGFISLVSVAVTKCQEVNPVELEIHPPNGIKQGDDIRLICQIASPDLFDVNSISRVIDGEYHEIALNNVIKDAFKGETRYSTRPGAGKNAVEYSEVYIENAQGKDSGQIVCLNAGTNMEASEFIHVRVPVSKLSLQYKIGDGDWMEAMDGDTLTLNNDDDVSYSCEVEVEGDDTAPHVAITLNNRDITNDLESGDVVDEVAVVSSLEGFSNKRLHKAYQSSSDSPNIAHTRYNGKSLTCTAQATEYDPVSVTVNIEVHFAPTPEDDCRRQQLYEVGKGIELTCTMSMSPGPTSDQWQLADGTVIRSGGPQDARFSAVMQELGDDRYKFIMTGTMIEETDDLTAVRLSVRNGDDAEPEEVNINIEKMPESTTTTTTTQKAVTPENENKGDETETRKATDDGGTASSCILSSLLLATCLAVSKLVH